MNVTDLQFAVLTSLASGRQHGYALMREAEVQLGKPLPVATAYACFDALVNRGWIALDGDEVVHGRTRRHYVLTDSGRETLRVRADELAAQARLAHQRLLNAPGKAVTA
jgi:DNA-binding PadR family transcriptional regulator